jgi:hypothetical protein
MQPEPHPVNDTGEKNINCPHYGFCLNHAAHNLWNAWTCSDCVYKTEKKAFSDLSLQGHGAAPFYSLAPEISKKLRLSF